MLFFISVFLYSYPFICLFMSVFLCRYIYAVFYAVFLHRYLYTVFYVCLFVQISFYILFFMSVFLYRYLFAFFFVKINISCILRLSFYLYLFLCLSFCIGIYILFYVYVLWMFTINCFWAVLIYVIENASNPLILVVTNVQGFFFTKDETLKTT